MSDDLIAIEEHYAMDYETARVNAQEAIHEWDYDTDPEGYRHLRSILIALLAEVDRLRTVAATDVADRDGFMMLEVEDGSIVSRPGLRSRIKRVGDEIRIFCGDAPDTAEIQIEIDTFDEAVQMAARMVPHADVAVRRRYVSDWQVVAS
jgi:hypothetical protein